MTGGLHHGEADLHLGSSADPNPPDICQGVDRVFPDLVSFHPVQSIY